MEVIDLLLFNMQIIDRITLFLECHPLKAAFLAIFWVIHNNIFSKVFSVEFENEIRYISYLKIYEGQFHTNSILYKPIGINRLDRNLLRTTEKSIC